MEFIIVTGLSGAGKSQAMNCMEDLGYFCIDNMPPGLIKYFIRLSAEDKIQIEKAAFVIDIRGGEFFDEFKNSLEELKNAGLDFKILFLEASDEVLIRRFKETRRAHPLSNSIQSGIMRERDKLREIRAMADNIIDTSSMKSAQLADEIKKLLLSEQEGEKFTLTFLSFGFKNGIPLDADLVLDVRFLPNPFYLSSMKKLTGNSKKVQDYVLKFPEATLFIETMRNLIQTLIPSYEREGKFHLVVAFGCTGGQHRSVVMTNEFSRIFLEAGKRVITLHRDL